MKEVLTYFKAERFESLVFMITGAGGLLVALWFLLSLKKPFYSGIATSLATIALVQLIIGSTIYLRTPKDIVRLETIITNHRSKIKSEEVPRMEKVMHNFVTYRYAEIVLALIGLALLFYFKNSAFPKGVGVGVFVQSVLMLGFDAVAENRGAAYLNFLRSVADQ
jgi:hypothetical protein